MRSVRFVRLTTRAEADCHDGIIVRVAIFEGGWPLLVHMVALCVSVPLTLYLLWCARCYDSFGVALFTRRTVELPNLVYTLSDQAMGFTRVARGMVTGNPNFIFL